MKMKIIAFCGITALITIISACGGGATNTNNSSNTANANKTTTNTNTTTNATNSSNSSNTTSNSTSDSNKTNSSSTSGDAVNFDPSGIKLNVPKGWGMSRDGDALIINSPDKTIVATFVAMSEADFEEGTMKMANELDKSMKNVKVEDEGSKDKQDGMDLTASKGTGVDKATGKDLVWMMASIKTPKKPVLVTIVGETDNFEKHSKEFGQMLDSIKKQ